MTAHEASGLFLEYLNTYSAFMFGYVGILTAFLVMSYAAAHKLNKLLAVLVVTLFSLVCVMLIIQINFLRNDLTGLYVYLVELKGTNPESLVWFGTNPAWMPIVLTWVNNTVSLGGFAASISYFLYQRQTGSRVAAA